MNLGNQPNRSLRLIALCLAFLAAPAWAVVEQTVAFPDADAIQGGTLRLDDGQEYTGEVREDDDGRKVLVFMLPDSANGARATVDATVDGRRETRSITITGRAVTLMSAGAAGTGRSGGFFFGAGAGLASYATDVASNLASRSAAEGTALFTELGLQNIAATSGAGDSDSVLDLGFHVGYRFANDSELYFGYQRPVSSIELDLNSNILGNLPGVNVTAESVGMVDLDFSTFTLNYAGYFGPATDFRYVVWGGAMHIDRETSFTSSLDVNNMVTSFSGGDDLKDSQAFYGAALEWAPRSASGWRPILGIGIGQSAKSGDLEDESATVVSGYFRTTFGF